MKLKDLKPSWSTSGGPGVTDVEGKEIPVNPFAALELDCPCGCGVRCIIPTEKGHGSVWQIKDTTDFEMLTLTPSIQVTTGCKTHFHITAGEITP